MSSLKKNVVSLTIVQLCVYVVPLLQFPYLTRVLGVEIFGVIAYSLSLMLLANIITDYGLNLYLPQRIASGENSTYKISRIFTESIIIKFFLLIITLLIFFAIIYTNSNYKGYSHYFLLFSFVIIANGFIPVWLFIGMEQLYYYSRVIITTKLISLILIYFFVKSVDDLNVFGYIYIIQAILSLLILLLLAKKKYNIKIVYVAFEDVKCTFKISTTFFLSRASAALYSSLCLIMLGYCSTPIQVAYYNAAEQLYKAGQQVFWPINQAIYPYMVRTKNYKLFYKVIFVALLVAVLGALFGVFWGADILELIYGKEFIAASNILSVFMIAIVINTLGSLMGYPALVPIGLSKIANNSVIIAGLFQIIVLCSIYYSGMTVIGKTIAYSVVACELLVATIRCIGFYRGMRRQV
ncbi:oligosaccharide flippase family protein [Enterobacillus tribolii]|uniref:PST family polysaccharide transporter n=1 Tax=Enterobacillus tribolii TaxID=1487935 RepID=A0A370R2N4_9GAMM|nr:oligosaccharide flippase family protein [Enterobacillus tribolii]MBW7984693.1 hypothetical protein [Enterobacillus tribolii]RDK96690.1 PST family polysaccharide transporter [Enterobacillus tribolii]